MTPNHSIYIHIPFCTHRCAYCDFNTYAGQEDAIPAYVDALIREIEFIGHRTAELSNYSTKAHTIFFGGGTPSLLSPKQFESILKAVRAHFPLTDSVEITIEANPGTVSYSNLLELRQLGINRISFGAQSANTEELRMLERAHDFFDVIEAVSSARKAGFDNLNLDLIYGLPEQGLKTWQTTVKRILDLHPEHISAYALTLEHGTPFGRWSAKGLLPLPDPDLAAEMYEWTGETLEANGLFNMRSATGQRTTTFIPHPSSFFLRMPAATTSNTGADFRISPLAQAHMDMRMAIVTRTRCESRPTLTGYPILQLSSFSLCLYLPQQSTIINNLCRMTCPNS